MPHNPYGLDGLTVLHLAQPVEGGVARVVTDLAAAQVRGGARVVVACPPGGPLAETAAAAGAETVRWSARRAPGPGLAREATAVARVLADVDPDLLHLHSAKAGLAGRLAAHGTLPTVFQPHAWSYEAARGPLAAAAARWERYAARWTDRILCVSEAERSGGQAHGIRAAWAVVPNGVDTARFAPRESAAAARARLPLLRAAAWDAVDVPLVVCVGRLCRQKGQDVLLRAWPAIAERLPAARLVLVGDGPDRQRLAAAAPPGVLVAGPAQDPVPWYRAADLVVQPSRWEGMALAPLEAMACGRPVVVADVAGARESVPPEDIARCVVPAGDADALATAVIRLLASPTVRAAAAARALSHIRAHHDLRRTTAEVSALYAQLLAIPPAPASWCAAPTAAPPEDADAEAPGGSPGSGAPPAPDPAAAPTAPAPRAWDHPPTPSTAPTPPAGSAPAAAEAAPTAPAPRTAASPGKAAAAGAAGDAAAGEHGGRRVRAGRVDGGSAR